MFAGNKTEDRKLEIRTNPFSLTQDQQKKLEEIKAANEKCNNEKYQLQERNKQDAINRLKKLIIHASFQPKKRRKTKPTFSSKQKRLNTKKLHGKAKSLRRSQFDHD